MTTPLIRSFSRFEDATRARDELLAAGLPPAAVQLRVAEDEAGPVEGNFVIGNGRSATGAAPGPLRVGGDVPYAENFAAPSARGTNLLIVEAGDARHREQALAILDGYGEAIDIEPAGDPDRESRR